jgi:transposase
MSAEERERMVLLRKVKDKHMLLKEAAFRMGVSLRQAVRIKKRFLREGDQGLVHGLRGMPSHRGKPHELKRKVILLYQEQYHDFGPTFASEKMFERDGVTINHETLRRWLIESGDWQMGRKERVHRLRRLRKEMFGLMLLIDGSDHDWLEGRGPRCTLLVLVDDATGQIALYMAEAETTLAALMVLRKWVKMHGVPVSIYADRRSVYFTEEFIHCPERRSDPSVFTDFMKVTNRLGIEMIPCYSPQAKGRVERANRTLQDRLVKELRLRNICTIQEANAMLDDYAKDYNRRFGLEPLRPCDAHRSAPKGVKQWQYYFCTEAQRVVQKDNTVSHNKRQWQILKQPQAPQPGSRVTLRTPLTGDPYWLWQDKPLRTKYLGKAVA